MTCHPSIAVSTFGEYTQSGEAISAQSSWFLRMCLYHREVGIGSTASPGTTKQIDSNRTEILKLLITCFSEPLYLLPEGR